MNSEVIIMTGLMKTETKPREVVDRFDRIFEDWMQGPLAWLLGRDDLNAEMIRVDEFRDNGNLVIRAELPGLDPKKDVEVTVADGLLHIEAHRGEKKSKHEKGYTRRELRYGSFMRTLPLPDGVSESDVTAGYMDGILEIKVPAPASVPAPTPKATKIANTKG
jgi:HSP20 family protein